MVYRKGVQIMLKSNTNNINTREFDNFKKDKIKTLNSFFMKKIVTSSIVAIFIFILSIVFLIIIINIQKIDEALKITLISITVSFILTTTKTLIDKSIQIVTYLVLLLSEEQRGINQNIGIAVDKIDFKEMESKIDLEN